LFVDPILRLLRIRPKVIADSPKGKTRNNAADADGAGDPHRRVSQSLLASGAIRKET
jgi:hypothetical protein